MRQLNYQSAGGSIDKDHMAAYLLLLSSQFSFSHFHKVPNQYKHKVEANKYSQIRESRQRLFKRRFYCQEIVKVEARGENVIIPSIVML